MERRGDERARSRHRLERLHDVGRIEGPAALEGRAAVQRQQQGRLQPVAVLHRHGGHQREAAQGVQTEQVAQARHGRLDVVDQGVPALGMRLRHAGRTGGEQAHRMPPAIEARHGWVALARLARAHHRHMRQPGRVERRVVGEDEGRGVRCAHPCERVGTRVGRQQARMAAQQRRPQADREGIAVAAHVDGRALGRQHRRLPGHVGQEGAGTDRPALVPGQRGVEVALAEQGKGCHCLGAAGRSAGTWL